MNTICRILLQSLVIFIPVYLAKCHHEYYAEYNVVKSELKKIEGIKVLEMGGNPDLTLEDIWANILLSTGDTVHFYGLGSWSFDSTSYIWLTRINQWDFHTTGCRSRINFELGFPANYKALVDLHLKSVPEVIQHIDTIKMIINTIATYPDFDTLVNLDGHTFYYQKYDVWQMARSRDLPEIECPIHNH